jgi:hypothetical protein
MAGTIVIDRIESDGSYNSAINVASNVNFSAGMTIGGQSATFGNRNKIINGSMLVAQRNTSTTGAVTLDTTAGAAAIYANTDRWRFGANTCIVTDARTTDVPTGQGFTYSKKITVTQTSSNASRYAEFFYGFEGQDLYNMGWVPTDSNSFITLSFWAKSSLAGTYVVQFRGNTSTGFTRQISKYFTLAANTWTKVTWSVPGDSTLTIANDYTEQFNLWINLDTGTNFTDTASSPSEVWFNNPSNGNYYKDYTQSWLGTVGNTFAITGVQLELGKTATPFEFKTYDQELRMCQRYYHCIIADGTLDNYAPLGHGRWYDAQWAQILFHMPTQMRLPPTLDAVGTTGASTFALNLGGNYSAGTCTQIDFNERSYNTMTINARYTSGGQTVGQGTTFYCNNATFAKIGFTAEF